MADAKMTGIQKVINVSVPAYSVVEHSEEDISAFMVLKAMYLVCSLRKMNFL